MPRRPAVSGGTCAWLLWAVSSYGAELFLRRITVLAGEGILCLYFPKDHPFWTERERGGTWESLGVRETKTTVLDGPGLCFCNHGANGTTELRTGKAEKEAGDDRGMWNYCKLSYSTKYPWESEPVTGIESQPVCAP